MEDQINPQNFQPKLSLQQKLSLILSRLFNPLRQTKVKMIGLITISTLVILGAGLYLLSTNFLGPISRSTKGKVDIAPAIATANLNKEFSFPLLDEKGKEVARVKYEITSSELRDEIVVKGQRATSVKGRFFLIFNIKIVNNYNKAIQINTRDYIRLIVNNNEGDLLAPDIHNDPVEVQAASTKFTRVGYAINESDKDLKIRIGELNGQKETVELNF